MPTTRPLLLLVVPLLLVAALAFWWFRGREGDTDASLTGPSAAAATQSGTVAETVASHEIPASRGGRTQLAPAPRGNDADGRGPAAKGTGSVTGRLVDESARPVAGVEVALSRMVFPRALGGDRNNAERQTVSSGADGRFVLDGVAAGDFEVRLRAEQWAASRGTLVAPVAEGKRYDLGDIAVVPAANVDGIVVDESGAPIADAQVAVSPATAGTGLMPLMGFGRESVRSDAQGAFKVIGLLPGKYALRAVRQGFVPGEVALGELGRGERKSQVRLVLAAGASIHGRVLDDMGQPIAGADVAPRLLRVDGTAGVSMQRTERARGTKTDVAGWFVLKGIEPTEVFDLVASARGHMRAEKTAVKAGDPEVVFQLPRTATIEGRLVDSQDKPIADAEVTAHEDPPRGPFNRSPEATTDKDGAYRLEGIQPGKVTVAASPKGRPEVESPQLTVAPGQVLKDVALVARRSGATVLARVEGPDGKPLAGARVTVVSKAQDGPIRLANGPGTSGRRLERRVTAGRGGPPRVFDSSQPQELGAGETGVDGVARIEGIPPGEVVVRARHGDFAPATAQVAEVSADETVERTLRVRAGGSIAGTCVGPSGAPLSGKAVAVRGPKEEERNDEQDVQSGADGTFRFDRLAPGTYLVRYKNLASGHQDEAAGGGDFTFRLAGAEPPDDPFAVRVAVAENQSTPVTLREPARVVLTGKVLDTAGAVGGAIVKLLKPDDADMPEMPFGGGAGHSAKSKKTGIYAFNDMLPGEYILRWQRNAQSLASEIRITLDEVAGTVTRDLRLPGGSIAGKVVDAKGQPVAGARIVAERGAAPGQPRAERRGVMAFMVTADGGSDDPSTITAESGGRNSRTESGADGSFVLRDVPEGSWVLDITHDASADTRTKAITVGLDAAVDAGVVAMSPGGAIEGTVQVDKGNGFPMVRATPVGGGEGDAKRSMARRGRFSFKGLKPGRYSVVASQPGPDGERTGDPMEVEVKPGETERINLTVR